MFKVDDDNTVHITRGDQAVLGVIAYNENDSEYIFKVGDIIRLSIFKKKDLNTIVLKKDVIVSEETTQVEMILTSEDTTIDDIINKPVDYWYEVQLNPDVNPQTIIGYDEDGPKIFRLYPEGADNIE